MIKNMDNLIKGEMSILFRKNMSNQTDKIYFICRTCGKETWMIKDTVIYPITLDELFCDDCFPIEEVEKP